mgnify:CR=1 FL=1
MNRIVLVLNVVVLLVNFVVCLTFSTSQIGILDTTLRASSYGSTRGPSAGGRDVSTAYLRVVQSLDSIVPGGAAKHTPEQYRAVYDAVALYYEVVQAGVANTLGGSKDPSAISEAYAEIGRAARFEVERALVGTFHGPTVQRLTTEIIRNCS